MNNARISHAHRANSIQHIHYTLYTKHISMFPNARVTLKTQSIFRDLKFESFQYEALCSVFSVHASTFNISHWILCAFHKVVSSHKRQNSYLVQKCSRLWKWHTEKLMAFTVQSAECRMWIPVLSVQCFIAVVFFMRFSLGV